jgi:hypothetical protein
MASVVFINSTLLICMIVEATYFVKALNNVNYCNDSLQTVCDDIFYKFMSKLGKISGSYYGILSIALIATYAKLNYSLKRRFNDVSGVIMRSINILFGVLVVSYVIRTIFLYCQGSFHKYIKSYMWRFELELVFWPVFDFLCFVPIFLMHRKNFSV